MHKLYFLYEVKTGKIFYVGITSNSIEERLRCHIKDSKRNKNNIWILNSYISRKIRKLQSENINFNIECILQVSSLQEVCFLEIKYIKWCKDLGIELCNTTSGGDVSPMLFEKVKQKFRGDNNPMKREENKEKFKGDKNPSKREDVRKLISKKLKGRKNYWMIDVNKLLKSKPVCQYSKKGDLLKEFPSATLAAEYYSVTKHSILNCCKGKSKTSCGFIWRYKND